MATPGHERLDALTSLRFFAALHVVFLHGGLRLFRGAPQWLENVRACGYASVSFFFVLSGFVLTYNYVDLARPQPLDVRRFFVARFSRLYPVYFLALLFLGAVSLKAFGAPFFYRQIASGIASLTLLQAWFPAYATRWNFPGWSISTEAFFYVVFPLLAAGLRRTLGARLVVLFLTLAWALSLAISSLAWLFQPEPGTAAANYWSTLFVCHPLARLPEFVAGACLGRLFLGDRAEGRRRDGTLMALVGLAGTLLIYSQSARIAEPLLQSGLVVPFFALTLFGFAHGARGLGGILSHPALVALGDASYALYILQIPVALLVMLLAGQPPVLRDMSGPLFVVDLAVLVVLSLLTFRFLERPVQRALRSRLGNSPGRSGDPPDHPGDLS